MKSYIHLIKIKLLLIFIVIALTLIACSLVTLRVHNETDKTLQIFRNGVFIGQTAPGGEATSEIERYYSHYEIIAKDLDGNIIYSKTFVREEIEEIGFRVVIPPKEIKTESSDNITE